MNRNPNRPRRDIDDDDLTSSSSDDEEAYLPDIGAAGDALRPTPLLLQGRLNLVTHQGAGEPAPHGYPRVMRPFNLWQIRPRAIGPLQQEANRLPFGNNRLGGEAAAIRVALNRIRLAPPLPMNRLPIFIPFRIEPRVENVVPIVDNRHGHGDEGRPALNQQVEPDHIPPNNQVEPDHIPPNNQVQLYHIPPTPLNRPRDHRRPVGNQNEVVLNGPNRYNPRPPANLPVARDVRRNGLHRLGDRLPGLRPAFPRNDIPPWAGNRRHLAGNDLMRNAGPPPGLRTALNHIHQYFRRPSASLNIEPSPGQPQEGNRLHEGLFQNNNVVPQSRARSNNIHGCNRGPSRLVRGLPNPPSSCVNQPQPASRRYSRDNLNGPSVAGPRFLDPILPNRHQPRRTYARSTGTSTNNMPSGDRAGYGGAVNLQYPDDIPVRDQRELSRDHTQGAVATTSRSNTNNLRGLWQRGRNWSTVNPPQVANSDRGRSRILQPPISRPKGRSLGDIRQDDQINLSCSQSHNAVATTSQRHSRGSEQPQQRLTVKAAYAGRNALDQRSNQSPQNQADLSQLFTRRTNNQGLRDMPQPKETIDTIRRQHSHSRGSWDLRRDQNRPSGTHPATGNTRYGANAGRALDLGLSTTRQPGDQNRSISNQAEGVFTKTARQHSQGGALRKLQQQDRSSGNQPQAGRVTDLRLPTTGQQGDQNKPVSNQSQGVDAKTARQHSYGGGLRNLQQQHRSSGNQPQAGKVTNLRLPTTGQQGDQNKPVSNQSQGVDAKTARQHSYGGGLRNLQQQDRSSGNQPQAGRVTDLRLPTTGQQGDQNKPVSNQSQGVDAKTARQHSYGGGLRNLQQQHRSSGNQPQAGKVTNLRLPTTGQQGDQNKPVSNQSQGVDAKTARQHSYGGGLRNLQQQHRSSGNQPQAGKVTNLRLPTTGQQGDRYKPVSNHSQSVVAKTARQYSQGGDLRSLQQQDRSSENQPQAGRASDLGLPTTGQQGDQNTPAVNQSQGVVTKTARQHSHGRGLKNQQQDLSSGNQPQARISTNPEQNSNDAGTLDLGLSSEVEQRINSSNTNQPHTTGSTSNIHGSLGDLRLRDQNQSTLNKSKDAVAKRKRRFSF